MFTAKRARVLLLLLCSLVFAGVFARAAAAKPVIAAQDEESKVEILSPGGGNALQGIVSITGTTDIPGFRAAEVSFSYQDDSPETWFLIQQMSQPVKEGNLASWDTSTISDGDYRLRLQVFLQGGGVQESLVRGLRVRNYTRIETSTPQAGERIVQPTFTASPLPDFAVTPRVPTPAPTNPAEVSPIAVRKSILNGALVVVGALGLGIFYAGIRSLFRRLR